METVTVERELRRILDDVVPDHGPFGPDDELIDAGFDSLALVEAVTRIESGFGLTFSESDICHVNFASLRAMTTTVERLQP